MKMRGVTIIEFVIVALVLGILAIIAVPKFINLSTNKTSPIASLAGDLSEANTLNYSSRKADPKEGIKVGNCKDIAKAVPEGLPEGYSITDAKVAPDATINCTLLGPNKSSALFTATGVN